MERKFILGILGIIFAISLVSAAFYPEPFNTNVDFNNYNATGADIMSAKKIIGAIIVGNYTGAMNWTVLQNYPVACPGSSAVTTLDDSVTCSDLWVNSAGDNMTGSLNTTSYINARSLNVTSPSYFFSDVNITGTLIALNVYNHTIAALTIGNNSYVKLGTQNQTVLHCSNLTGNTLCANFTFDALSQINNSNLFMLMSENATLWNEAKDKHNDSYVLKGSSNSTNISWDGNITNFPVACGVGTAVTQIAGTPVCTAFLTAYTETDSIWQGNFSAGTINVTTNNTLWFNGTTIYDYLRADNISILLIGQDNRTKPYCGNITGAASNLCTIIDTDTTYTNSSFDLSQLANTGNINLGNFNLTTDGYLNATNLTIGSIGITGNYSFGYCHMYFEQGIAKSTNCTGI